MNIYTHKVSLHHQDAAVQCPHVNLTYDERSRCRMHVVLESGTSIGISLDRGERLYPGDVLSTDSGLLLMIGAKPETLYQVHAHTALQLSRAAYHLGNRHVAVQLMDEHTLRFVADGVLAEMLRQMGCEVSPVTAAFEPESGAYGKHAHHDDTHDHATQESVFDPGHGHHRSPRRIHDFTEPSA